MKKKLLYGLVATLLAASATALGLIVASGHGSRPAAVPKPVAGTFADLASSVAAIKHSRGPADQLTAGASSVVSAFGGEVSPRAASQSLKVFETPATGPVYVVPAMRGFALVTSHGGGLIPGTLGHDNPAAGGAVQADGSQPGYVFGIAADDVTGVDVALNGQTYHARMLKNGYVWVAPDASLDVTKAAIFARLQDGTVVRG
jgi:hypothetical protein